MKTLQEFFFESIEEVELNEESAAATSMTGGVAMPDSPNFKKKKVFGQPCIEVDSETYHACVRGKMPFKRWSSYVKDDALRDEMKKIYYSNKRVLVQDARQGNMAYVK